MQPHSPVHQLYHQMIEKCASFEHQVNLLREKVRSLIYAVMLFQRKCRGCGASKLRMIQDSWCRCQDCGDEFDPTLHLQTCEACNGSLTKKIYHYWCSKCRAPVRSRYTFDERVFDATYFREMMRESRKRRREKTEEIRKLLLNSRSPPHFSNLEPILEGLPDFQFDLDQFISLPSKEEATPATDRLNFEMSTYRAHIQGILSGCIIRFEGVRALLDDLRLDRIYRFITVIFMQHDGEIEVTQDPDGEILLEGK